MHRFICSSSVRQPKKMITSWKHTYFFNKNNSSIYTCIHTFIPYIHNPQNWHVLYVPPANTSKKCRYQCWSMLRTSPCQRWRIPSTARHKLVESAPDCWWFRKSGINSPVVEVQVGSLSMLFLPWFWTKFFFHPRWLFWDFWSHQWYDCWVKVW